LKLLTPSGVLTQQTPPHPEPVVVVAIAGVVVVAVGRTQVVWMIVVPGTAAQDLY
jgi:hypothetical protein